MLGRKAFENTRVTPGSDLYTVADLSTVWVNAEIYEYEVPFIREGGRSHRVVELFPGARSFHGKISYIYPQLDTTTRTLKVRIELPNPQFKLKPDMYAHVQLNIDYGTKNALFRRTPSWW